MSAFFSGIIITLLAVLTTSFRHDTDWEYVKEKYEYYYPTCESANSIPKSWDSFTLTCANGAKFDISEIKNGTNERRNINEKIQ